MSESIRSVIGSYPNRKIRIFGRCGNQHEDHLEQKQNNKSHNPDQMQKLTFIVVLQLLFIVMSSKRDVLNARNARRRAAYARDKANRERAIIDSNPPPVTPSPSPIQTEMERRSNNADKTRRYRMKKAKRDCQKL